MKKKENKSIRFLVLIVMSLALAYCGEEDEEPLIIPGLEEDDDEIKECPDTTFQIVVEELGSAPGLSNYTLTWEDDFDYPDSQLDENWTSQNGPSGHIDCSRWRENAVVNDGILELKAIKENRGGQEWTCGNIWTKEAFKYGYFEARYKYAGATGTNNSFWLFSTTVPISGPVVTCELDINEGHFPNEINTNVHLWQNGNTINDQYDYAEGLSPGYAHTFEEEITTTKIRFSSTSAAHFHIREFRIYEPNENCYPENILSPGADGSVEGLTNLSRASDVSITASGIFEDRDNIDITDAADGNASTSWVSQFSGEKWLEFEWTTAKNIGHIQFINGWQDGGGEWKALPTNYKIEAWVNNSWEEVVAYDVETLHNYANEYHIYGMEWTEQEIKYYFDNQLVNIVPNQQCNEELSVWLSLAIFDTAGEVTDAIDGTSMKIDWVRYYERN